MTYTTMKHFCFHLSTTATTYQCNPTTEVLGEDGVCTHTLPLPCGGREAIYELYINQLKSENKVSFHQKKITYIQHVIKKWNPRIILRNTSSIQVYPHMHIRLFRSPLHFPNSTYPKPKKYINQLYLNP